MADDEQKLEVYLAVSRRLALRGFGKCEPMTIPIGILAASTAVCPSVVRSAAGIFVKNAYFMLVVTESAIVTLTRSLELYLVVDP
jgi:hypothetical protein